MLLQNLIQHCQQRLKEAGVGNPQLDTRLLIAHALHCDRAALITQNEREVTAEEMALIDAYINRRTAREPVGRIIGVREFWGLQIGVNEATLEPRPDSETLVTTVLNVMQDRYYHQKSLARGEGAFHVLDLGTGSGCLLLAILSEWKEAFGTGIDRSKKALEQAAANATSLGFSDRVKFKQGNWLSGLSGRFDVVICNPPYIKTDDIQGLQPEVKLYDPPLALDGGADGLAPYNQIIPMLPHYLNQDGAAFFEVGKGQAQDIAELMRSVGFKKITTQKDLGGVARCVGGIWEGSAE